MKKFILILVVTLALIGVAIWEQITVNTYLNDVEEKSKYLIEITTNVTNIQTEEIIEKVEELEESWTKQEQILCLFANHKDMRDLCIEIQKLRGNIEVNQYEDFTASLKVIYHLCNDYHKIMGTSWQNIF